MHTIFQPGYGPNGEPFTYRAVYADGAREEWFGTEQEAWDARDAALDAGALHARVLAAPTRGHAAGFPEQRGALPDQED